VAGLLSSDDRVLGSVVASVLRVVIVWAAVWWTAATVDRLDGLRRAAQDAAAATEVRFRLERDQLLISERAARDEAERANRAKDEFLATLSHELRTPLNALVGWIDLLRDGTPDGEELQHGLQVMARNAEAQVHLVDDLLDLSRIASGTLRTAVKRVNYPSVITAALDTVRPMAAAKGVALGVSMPDTAIVTGDPDRLQQVVWNLMTNAIKFTAPGGRVDVEVTTAGSNVELTIRDTGQGIAPAFLPHVFDPFRQEDASATRRHGGLGVGLALVRRLVDLHGGEVRAASDGPGRGATFVVTLPVLPALGGERPAA
jgi:signal transduction histidine kinase